MMFVDEVHVNGLKFRVHPVFDQYGGRELLIINYY